MKTYSVRDLKEHPGEIISGAQAGELSLVTRHGIPVFVAMPFSDIALEQGVHVALAVDLYRKKLLSLGKAAKVAKMPLETFMECVGRLRISLIDYSEEELRAQLRDFS
jgi:predicted HTH domain antitoxin